MTVRTGLGPIETALLLTLDRCGARYGRPHQKSARVLTALDAAEGIGPAYAYTVLCDLARPWTVSVPLVDGHGNFGSPDDDAANPRYNECRLSPVGALAVEAEQELVPPLPIDLLNGTMYRGGTRPPFQPSGVIDALLAIVDDPEVSDETMLDLIGPPVFPSGCDVSGDIDALFAGDPADLRCSARITLAKSRDTHALEVTNLPPGWGPEAVKRMISERVNLPRWVDDHPELADETWIPLRDVRNESRMEETRIVCEIGRGADVDDVSRRLHAVWGVSIDIGAQLEQPAPALLRGWVRRNVDADTRDVLRQLRSLVVP